MLESKTIYYTGDMGVGFTLSRGDVYDPVLYIEIINDDGKEGDCLMFNSAEEVNDFISLVCAYKKEVFSDKLGVKKTCKELDI